MEILLDKNIFPIIIAYLTVILSGAANIAVPIFNRVRDRHLRYEEMKHESEIEQGIQKINIEFRLKAKQESFVAFIDGANKCLTETVDKQPYRDIYFKACNAALFCSSEKCRNEIMSFIDAVSTAGAYDDLEHLRSEMKKLVAELQEELSSDFKFPTC